MGDFEKNLPVNSDFLKRLGVIVTLLALLLAVVWHLSSPNNTREHPLTTKTKTEPAAQVKQPKGSFILDRAKKRLEEIDSRETKTAVPKADRAKALEALRREIPGVQVDFDPTTGAPSHIMAAGRFLVKAETGTSDPYESVRDFVSKHEGLFGHGTTAIEAGQARITREDVTAHNGMRTVVWQQEVAGVPVFQTVLKANLTKSGDLVTLGSHFMGDAVKAAGDQVHWVGQPPLEVGDAMTLVAKNLGGELVKTAVSPNAAALGAEQAQKLTAPGFTDTTAHLSWVPMSEDTLRLAWEVETFSLQQNEMFRMLVDAENGRVLVRQSITNDISNASYRVYAKAGFQPYDSPTPFAPGHSSPSSVQPPEVSRNLVTLDAVNTIASPNGWIDDGGTQTLGNNVDAHTDTDANNIADLPRPTSATRNFDFAMDLTQAPSTYRDAAVTNLFYLCNYIHDRFYTLGFTESAGNFQTNNFSRGGNGNDAVQADAQDGSGTNNANFSTPSDGSPGRMQMYVFTGPTPDRDGDLDHEIVIHEYTHGLSNRLVGGGVGISQSQTRGMGEGWSDFYALCLLSEATDDPNANYASGGYATKDFYGLTENYYYGIRRYPYATSLTKNPLTFKDIDPSQASSHAGIPRNSIISNTADEVHNQGEVWCMTLWEMRGNLVAKHGWAVGNELALQLTTDGMKLCPVNPNMLQSRDAIIQADLVSNGGANRSELWSAFAKRGMGSSASSPASSVTTGLIEAYDFPDDLSVAPFTGLTATGTIGGPFTPADQTFTLTNTGITPMNWTADKSQPWITLSATSGTLAAGDSTTVVLSFNTTANGLPPGSYTDTLSLTNATSGAVLRRSVNLTVSPYTIVVFSEPFATPTLSAKWTITGTNTFRTQVTSANTPNSAAYHLTMDSSVDGTYARNEATLTLDLSGRQHVQLSFWAKGFNDEGNGPAPSPFPSTGYDFDGVAISADGGTNWYEVQGLRAISGIYTKYVVNLDAVMTANGLNYGANFKFRFNQYDNFGITTDGIAIDDIVVAETVNNILALSVPDTATEGDAPLTATLSVTPAPSANLTVNLTSNSADASVPDTVLVPAGSASVTFPVTIVDDTELDGTQTATISATATTFTTASRTVRVNDNETAVLTVTIPSSAIEGSSPPQGSVSVSAAVTKAVSVTLVSDNTSAQVPASVTIPAGQTNALFSLNLPNDNLVNGNRSATISATVPNWTPGNATMTVLDDEVAAITLTLNADTHESAGAMAAVGTVTLGGTAVTPVVVTLASSDESELVLPATVTIPAGQSNATVTASLVDDTELDGTQIVTISATALGNAAVTGDIEVRDNDAASFVLDTVPSPQREGTGFSLTITAQDVNGLTLPAVAGPVTQTAANEAGAVSYLYPTAAFVNGVWQQNVRVMVPATDVVITVTGPQATAQSNAFDVVPGPHISVAPAAFTLNIPRQSSKTRTLTITNTGAETLTWSAAGSLGWLTALPTSGSVPVGQSADVAVTFNAATLAEGAATAQLNLSSNDGLNPVVAVPVTLNVTPPVASFVWDTVASPQLVNAPFPVTVTAKDTGGATVTEFEGSVALAGGIGGAGVSRTLLNSPTYNLTYNVGTFTIGYSFTPSSNLTVNAVRSFSGVKVSIWTDTGTLLTSVPVTAAGGTWSETPLPVPLQLQSGVTYRVSFLSGGMPYYGRNDMSSSFPDGTINTHYEISGDAFPTNTSSSWRWILVDLSYSIGTPVAITPVKSGSFASGVWTGDVAVLQTADAMALIANDSASHTGASNAFDVQSLGTLSLTLAPQVSEGAGVLDGTVTISPAPTTDVVVALSSTVATAAVPVVPTVTVPAGSSSVDFTLSIIDDALLDGSQTTQIGAVSAGFVAVSTALVVADDESAVLTIDLAESTYAESAGTISGTLTASEAPTVPITVMLASSDTSEATVPVSVTLPAGATSVPFSLTVVDDTLLDGPQSVELTASVTGWTSGTKTLTITDNELRKLTINGVPASISEGAATLATPSIALNGQAVEDIIVTLTSSDTTALPSLSVTIPAGATSAVFDLDPVDDLLFDGTQTVTLTASAATFTSDSMSVDVLDDDVHHFALSTVPALQKEGIGFSFTATAKDFNDVTITTAVGGPVTLTAAGDAGAVSVLPDVLTPFSNGVWTGNVRVMGAGTNLQLTVTSPTAVNQSNAFDVGAGPRLTMDPSSYALSVAQNTTKTRALTLNNTGAEPLTWSLSPAYALSAAPGAEFNGLATPITKEQAAARPATLWSQPRDADADAGAPQSLAGGSRTLEDCLAQINTRFAEVTALIPSRYDFSDGVTGTNISDGGGDMYDGGNYLNTNLGSAIPYSDNAIATPAASLGAGGRYFTRKQPGLFLFVADVAAISNFSITGNLGADGSGTVDGAVLTATRGGMTFKGFVKRVYNAGDPSVNHLIIVADNGSAAHAYASGTDDDQHTVSGLGGVTRVYYLLYAGQNGGYINDAQTTAIFTKFLDIAEVSNWLTATPTGGTIAAGASATVQVDFNASGMQPGAYQGSLQFDSNDGLQPQRSIPATMTVTPGLHHFDWDTLPSPQVVNTPFAATVRAKDSANNPVVDFEGAAALTALNTASSGEAITGTGTATSANIQRTSYPVHRTQCIYTPAETGTAGRLSGLALDVATLGSPAASNFTIRLKHTNRVNYSTDTSWEGSGWTVVFTGSKTLATGLNYFTFSTPFDYDGGSNLMVDISFANSTYSSSSYCKYTTASAARAIYYSVYSGDPLTWSGTSTYAYSTTALPNLRLVNSGAPALISPQSTGAFVNGVWTGEVRLGTAGTIVSTATATGATGTSNAVTTTATGTLTLTLPTNATEGQGLLTGAGTVSVSSPLAEPLTITLESLDSSEITLPATVTLPAGQSSVSFDVTIVDDALLDGDVAVPCHALAAGYPTATITTTVADNETTTLTLTLPASVTEGAAAAQGTVQLGVAAGANLTVTLSSSLTSRVSVPASIVVVAGQSSATFTLTTPENTIIDGTQTATITATLAGSAAGVGTVQVIDNESTALTLYLSYNSVSEGAAPLTSAGYAYVSGTVTTPLTITLTSNDTTELTVPATITIPAGSSQSNYFTLTPVNDALKDGSQIVTVTAAAAGFTSSSRGITVLDDDVHHFAISAVGNPQVRNAPFSATFTAQDINNVTITTYTGTPALTAMDGVTALGITPTTLSGFSYGAKTQSLTISSFATSAVITVTDAAAGASGSSNAFAVTTGALDHFGLSAVPANIGNGASQPVTITAQDVANNTVTTYTQPANLTISNDSAAVISGTGTSTWSIPLGSLSRTQRMQVIYLPAEVGTARVLNNLALYVSTLPGSMLNNFTIRMKHSALTAYSSYVWHGNEWTTVYQGNATVSATGWKQFDFTTPFSYDGSSSLMIDFSYYNASAGTTQGYTQYTTASNVRSLMTQTDIDYGSPLAWLGAGNPTPTGNYIVPNVRFGTTSSSIPVSPTITGSFANGVWSGSFTPGSSGANVRLRATNGAVTGASNAFSVGIPTLSVTLPATASESAGSVSGTVSITTAPSSALTVNLSSNDTSEAQPATATVTIPAGATSVGFTLNIINDTLRDGAQSAVITASASGALSGMTSISVADDDVDHFVVSTVASQLRNAPFTVTFTARDVNSNVLTNYNGTPVLTASTGGTALNVSPGTVTGFSAGVKSQVVTVADFANTAVLKLTDATTGGSGSSNTFVVSYSTAAQFGWSTITSPSAGTPFPATITAQDKYGNTVGNYSGSANITAMQATSLGGGGTTWSYPFHNIDFNGRTQIICTTGEVGGAKSIRSLSLNVTALPTSSIFGSLTIRMKHTTKSDYSMSTAFETSGWTTCYQGSTAAFTGWNTFNFTTPFDYDGAQNVLIDFAFSTSSATGSATVSATNSVRAYSIYYSTPNTGDPLLWSFSGTTSTLRPDFILGSDAGLVPSPASTGNFTAGVWNGNISIPTQADNVKLFATSGSLRGFSNTFDLLPPLLVVTLPATASESAGNIVGNVSLSIAQASALTVTLSSNDTTAAQPATATVTIPAGATSVGFTLNIINDTLRDGTQNAVITASAAGMTSGTASINVTDDDVDHFQLSAVGSQVRNVAFMVTITARDVNNATITSYNGSPVLTAANGGTALTVSPGTVSGFSAGVKTTGIALGSFADNAVLTLTDPVTGGSGSSNAFIVSFGSLTKFAWGTINSPQVMNVPFPVTVTAQDAAGNTVTTYSGSTALAAPINASTPTVGTGLITNYAIPFNTIFSKCRSQQVHLASEVDAAGQINALAFYVTAVPLAQTLTDFTIRVKHTSRTGYVGSGDYVWESTGFTTVYQGTPTISATGYATFTFTTPFVYDGTSNLMVDYSYRAVTSTGSRPTVTGTTRTNTRCINYYTSSSAYGEPLTWTGTSTPAYSDSRTTDIRLSIGTYYPLSPAATEAFTDGVWTGNLTVGATATSAVVTATDAALTGTSNAFEVVSTALVLAAEPAFTGGLSNALSWNQPAAGLSYELQRSTLPDFSSPVSSGFLASTSKTFTTLADGQAYYYRLRMRRLGVLSWTSNWTPQVSSTQDATPPVISVPALTTSGLSATMVGTTVDGTSGISSVMVAGAGATTADNFANWTQNVPSLVDGSNSITVTATDKATPPNSTTVTAIIYRIATVTGDTNHNGVSNLMEHALGIPAGTTNPRSMLPNATLQTDAGSGDQYLTMQFRRRIQRTGLTYSVETSSNLMLWDNTGANVQEMGTAPSGDGITEVVTVRVTPAMSSANSKKFVRLSVTTN